MEPTINGVTLGEDGAVYYTDQATAHVYRVTAGRHQDAGYTTSPLEDLNGIAFGPDKNALRPDVRQGEGHPSQRWRPARRSRVRPSPTSPAAGTPTASPSTSRAASTSPRAALFRVSGDGKTVESLGEAYGANADFGIGALGCSDLYTAGNGKGIFRFENDTPGGDVPWHRPVARMKDTVPPPSPPPAPPAKLASKVKLELITTDTTEALGLVAAPGEPVGRLFVVEKRGPIRILRGKTFEPKPFLDMTGKVSLWRRRQQRAGPAGPGLPPGVLENGRFYVHYTDLDGRPAWSNTA